MTTFINTAEIGLTTGTAVTTANSGGGSGNFAFTVEKTGTGAVTVDSTAAAVHRGTYGFKFDSPAATDYDRGVIALSSVSNTCLETYMKCTALPPTVSSRKVHVISPSTGVYWTISTAGKFEVYDAATVRVYLSTAVITTGTWYRVSFGVGVGTTTGNGTIRFQFSSGSNLETNTPDEAASINAGITTSNTGTVAFTGIRFGHPATSLSGATYMDDVQYSDSSLAIIGAPGGTPPTNAWTTTNQVIYDVSATSGTPTSQTLVQQSGPTVTIAGPTSGKFTVTLPNPLASAAVVRLTSTNASGSDVDDITIAPTGGATTNVIRDFAVKTASGLV